MFITPRSPLVRLLAEVRGRAVPASVLDIVRKAWAALKRGIGLDPTPAPAPVPVRVRRDRR